jgi:hypothetical protein
MCLCHNPQQVPKACKCQALCLAAGCAPGLAHTSEPYDSTALTIVLNSRNCSGAASTPRAAPQALQLCMAARAATALAGAAAFARQVLARNVMPRYSTLWTASNCWLVIGLCHSFLAAFECLKLHCSAYCCNGRRWRGRHAAAVPLHCNFLCGHTHVTHNQARCAGSVGAPVRSTRPPLLLNWRRPSCAPHCAAASTAAFGLF